MDAVIEKAIERLRAAGVAPRLAAPVDTEPPAPLKSSPPPVTRQVGQRKVKAGGG